MMWHKEPIAYTTPPDVRFTFHNSEAFQQISIAANLSQIKNVVAKRNGCLGLDVADYDLLRHCIRQLRNVI